MSKSLVFFGNERLATGVSTKAPALQVLINAGFDVRAVVSSYTRARSRNARELEIENVARNHNIPILLPQKSLDILHELEDFNADAAVLIAYGKILPQELIDIFPAGITNVHPSLLPLHRGPTPIESVILEGANETGVSLMQLTKDMDAGPIYAQTSMPLTGHETKQELADKLSALGAEMLVSNLEKIIDGSLQPIPQDHSKATYDKLITKTDGQVDWAQTAVQIDRQVRAYAGWPGVKINLPTGEATITVAHIADTNSSGTPGDIFDIDGELIVHTGSGDLVIDKLIPAGKAEMTAQAYLTGNPIN